MLVKPAEFGMIQQQNTVSQIRHEEDAKPMAEQQTMVVQSQKEAEIKAEQVVHKDDTDNRQKKFDAKDKSDNEYQSGHKKKRDRETPVTAMASTLRVPVFEKVDDLVLIE